MIYDNTMASKESSTVMKMGLYSSMKDFLKSNCELFEIIDIIRVNWVIENSQDAFNALPKHRQITNTQLDLSSSLYAVGWSTTIKHLKELIVLSEPTHDPRHIYVSTQYTQHNNK